MIRRQAIEQQVPNRRQFLRAFSGSLAGLTLCDILRLRAQAAESHDTSVIFITLGGGPAQHETYDPKPDAPLEFRGSFRPIATSVPGFQFCELLPQQAKMADRLAVIRSVHHEQASHIAEHIVETGYDLKVGSNPRTGDMPSIGAVVSRVRGIGRSGIPSYVSLPQHHGYAGSHWLGVQHHHFAINEDPNSENFSVGNLKLLETLSADRLNDRRTLHREFEAARRTVDVLRRADALDAFSDQAFSLITSDQARQAFDVSSEDAKVRDRYGRNILGQRMLLARRLVEAGVPFATVRMFDWDDHQDLVKNISVRAPMYDTAISALIDDLHDRGLTRKVLVVAMGEFGRTPRVNLMGGRDHWPAVNSVVLAGGSYRMGQVIGATDEHAGAVTAAPYRPQNVIGMVYRHLGIDPGMAFPDFTGRPRYVLEERESITELL
ncbi:MAG: DUF1501 domain-containing protein [Pirellulales bacterium]